MKYKHDKKNIFQSYNIITTTWKSHISYVFRLRNLTNVAFIRIPRNYNT